MDEGVFAGDIGGARRGGGDVGGECGHRGGALSEVGVAGVVEEFGDADE